MRILIPLIFTIGSAKAYRNDPPDQRYFIQNAITIKNLFIDHLSDTETYQGQSKNVCIEAIRNRVPDFEESGLFYVVANNDIGSYYNIINVGTNTTLLGSEIKVEMEGSRTLYMLLAVNGDEQKHKLQSLWNITHIDNDMYFYNVYYESYLYTNDRVDSEAILKYDTRLALLMPKHGGGMVKGTQWVLIRKGKSVDERYLDKVKVKG